MKPGWMKNMRKGKKLEHKVWGSGYYAGMANYSGTKCIKFEKRDIQNTVIYVPVDRADKSLSNGRSRSELYKY